MIEAEFHAVWVSAHGSWSDVIPRSDAEHEVLFVADPERVFEGRRVNNVRVASRDDPRIHEYICLADKQFEILAHGDQAFASGAVRLRKDEFEPVRLRIAELYAKLAKTSAGRNDPCPCGSGVDDAGRIVLTVPLRGWVPWRGPARLNDVLHLSQSTPQQPGAALDIVRHRSGTAGLCDAGSVVAATQPNACRGREVVAIDVRESSTDAQGEVRKGVNYQPL